MTRKLKKVTSCIVLLLVLFLSVGVFPALGVENEAVEPLGMPSLHQIYEDYFDLGVAVAIAGWSSKTFFMHRNLFTEQFNSVTAENEMKPDSLQPELDKFNFRVADLMVDHAMQNNMKVRGHTLVWHAQTPDWFFQDPEGVLIYEKDTITDEDRLLVRQRLEDHIEGVMNHYRGKVYAWDVVNEAISDNANHILRRESPWYRIFGDDFMEIAFRKAHEVDPEVKLFYNDYNIEMVYKRGRTKQVLENLINKGVPLHGVGIQGHWGVNGPSINEIEDAIKMYAELGLEIHITELDIGMDGRSLEAQAERYRQVFSLFKKYKDVITSVTLWGTTDDASWREGDNPLLFDANQEPKPAFWAIVDTNKSWEQNRLEHMGY